MIDHLELIESRMVKLANYGRVPILLFRDSGLPVQLATRYVATTLWGKESENTTMRRLNAISGFYFWARSLPLSPFDPETRLKEPSAIRSSDIQSLSQYFRLHRRHNAVAFPSSREKHSGSRIIVTNATVAGELSYVRDFVCWAAETQTRPVCNSDQVAELKLSFDAEIGAFRKSRTVASDSLTPDQQQRLREVCEPTSRENPFNTPVRFRNHAMIELGLNAPLRKGEMLGLRLEDVILTGGMASVTVVVQDETFESTAHDPRRHRPRQKTLGRTIPIVAKTKQALLEYLKYERPKRSTSPFFFLSSRAGRPLCLTAPNDMFRQLQNAVGSSFPKLKPHILRHTFNYNFKLFNVDKKLKGEQHRQVQNYLNGWSDRSSQSDAYGAAANAIIAAQFIEKMFESLKFHQVKT